jgi:O-antigen/teichoic acid export membrane protein
MSQSAGVLGSASAVRAEHLTGWSGRRSPTGMKRMISGASLVLGGSLVGQAANFLFNAVGAHALGPERYGVLAASMALLSFAGPLLAALQAVASREATSLAARKQLWKVAPMLRHYGLRVTGGSLVLAGAAAAASSWISGLFHLGSPWFVILIGATIPCYTVGHILGGLLQGTERFGRFALETVVEGSTKAIIGILVMGLLWHSALCGVATVAVSRAAGLVAYLLLTLPILDKSAPGEIAGEGPATAFSRIRGAHRRHPRVGMPGVVRYSMTALATYGLLALLLSSDTLVAKHYLSSHQAGLYAGVSLAGKIAYFATSSVIVVAFPAFCRRHEQGAGSPRRILASGGAVCAITGVIVTLFALQPAWVVIPLLGGRYRSAERYVPWMAAIFGLYALGFLVSVYLLARKRRGIIAVLAASVGVQFAGFFIFHSTITRMMGVLAAAFGVMLLGGVLLALLGGPREAGSRGRGRVPAQALPAGEIAGGMLPDPVAAAGRSGPGPRGGWRDQIVTEVARQVGSAPILLVGSRALRTAGVGSDYDVSVVLPLLRIPRAASRLNRASGRLSAALGAPVSVNAVPRFRMRRPGGSLFVGKLQAEGVVLAAPPGWSLRRQPLTGVTKFAASSALLSAARSLLETFDTSAMAGMPVPGRADDALRKAALHVAQVRLLRSGRYASDLDGALAQLRAMPPGGSGEVPAAELGAALAAGLAAVSAIEGFVRLRQCVLAQLAEIGGTPFRLPAAKSLVRNAQYAGLARLRGRSRWRVALSWGSVEAALAATQLELLRALDPGSAGGLNTAHLRLAGEALPAPLGTAGWNTWEELRDLALAEWLDAHPLVGLLA